MNRNSRLLWCAAIAATILLPAWSPAKPPERLPRGRGSQDRFHPLRQFRPQPRARFCHCASCTSGFRNHLKTKYSAAKRRERFGFENVDFVEPPQWNIQHNPARLDVIVDPAIQEWIDYRCQLMTDALREMALYAKSMNPEVAIEINPHGITGKNRVWESGLDHGRLLKWTEEENDPGLLPDGRLITKIRSYKLARAYDNILLAYISEDPVAMGEALAFNQTLGYVGAGAGDLAPEMLRYIAFYRKHRDLYRGTKEVASVAVLRSYPSITYNNSAVQLAAILLEQVLIQAKIPFDLIFDEHLADLSTTSGEGSEPRPASTDWWRLPLARGGRATRGARPPPDRLFAKRPVRDVSCTFPASCLTVRCRSTEGTSRSITASEDCRRTGLS